MIDDAKAAELLYGSTTPTEKPETNNGFATPYDHKLAQSLYPEMHREKVAKDKAGVSDTEEKSQAEKLFGEKPKPTEKSEGAEDDTAPATADDVEEIFSEMGLEAPEEFKELASESGFTKATVTKLMEMKQESDARAWEAVSDRWRSETENSFSNDEIESARNLVREYGGDDVRELMNSLQIGNHPALIRFLVNIAEERG